MKVAYRKLFLKDLKKLKISNNSVYQKVFILVFEELPQVDSLENISNIKALKNAPHRYRIRLGDYRIGIEVNQNEIQIMRVLHRREFYRYFP
jgi:mRNA interferase RelE/StbE